MAVPKNKVSKSKRDMRRANNFKLEVPALVKCSKCGAFIKPHHMCGECGFYNGREVIKTAE